MSKADGVSLPIEAEAFERQFSVPYHECEHVRRLYQLASQDIAGYEIYAAQIARMLEDQPELKVSVLECLFHIASADGVLHPTKISIWRGLPTSLDFRKPSSAASAAVSSSMPTALTKC